MFQFLLRTAYKTSINTSVFSSLYMRCIYMDIEIPQYTVIIATFNIINEVRVKRGG